MKPKNLTGQSADVKKAAEESRVAAESNSKRLDKLLYKIEQCVNHQSIFAMESDFNNCGLSIQTTANNRMILCRLQDGRPVIESVVDDYIFIGSLKEGSTELTDRAVSKISDFVRTHSKGPDTVKNTARVWRNGVRMYESIILVNEDVDRIADVINE